MVLCDPSLFSNLAVAIHKIKHKVVKNVCCTELKWAKLNTDRWERICKWKYTYDKMNEDIGIFLIDQFN